MKIYREDDADLGILKGKTIAIIGYGSQGHAHAQNLRDSGLNVIVGLHPEGAEFKKQAEADGLKVLPTAKAAAAGDVVMILIPDEIQAAVYVADIAPGLKKGNALGFAHGFNIHYGQIRPPEDVDVILVAPKGPGHIVRRIYKEGGGTPNLVAVQQDATGKALEIALAYSKGLGGTRAGVIETTFKEETETDLFGEQAVLCGGLAELIKAGFDTLVDAGYQPEIAYFECLHEMKLIIDLIYEGGISHMNWSISDTAEYGGMTRGPRLIDNQVRWRMREILAEIQNGSFAREYLLENRVNRPVFNALRSQNAAHRTEAIGKQLRAMMPFIKGGK